MTTKLWIIFVTILFAVTQEIYSACVCNEKGTDACSGCTGPRAVKPKRKHTEKPNIALPPVGDNCWCSKTLIEPASLPKPCSEHQKPTTTCECKSAKTSQNLPSILAPSSFSAYSAPQVNYVTATQPKDDSPPADPVSISLAIQAGRAIEVPEAKLAYGFVQKPIDGLPKVYQSSVKEENLYALKSDVITLKKPFSAFKQPEEDYPELDDEVISSSVDEEEPRSLTYKQLGYVAQQFRNPQFQEMPQVYAPYASSKPAVVRSNVAGDFGFRPGRIAEYKGHKNPCAGEECIHRY